MEDNNTEVEKDQHTEPQLPIEATYVAAKNEIVEAINAVGQKYDLSIFLLIRLVNEISLENKCSSYSNALSATIRSN